MRVSTSLLRLILLVPSAVLVLGGCASHPPAEHEAEQCPVMQEAPDSQVGRYEMERSPDAIFLLDTETGKIWVYQMNKWRELPSAPTTRDTD